jgi:hypothetical protein
MQYNGNLRSASFLTPVCLSIAAHPSVVRGLAFLVCLLALHPAVSAQQPDRRPIGRFILTAKLIDPGDPAPADLPDAPSVQVSTAAIPPAQPAAGTISGAIADGAGDIVSGARITLTRDGQALDDPAARIAISDDAGNFAFTNIVPGTFQLTVFASGFASRQILGELSPGETDQLPPIQLTAASTTNISVTASQEDIAEAQINLQEKQRVLGIFPNFYTSYDPHPVALVPRQKYELAFKTLVDPVSFMIIGFSAGLEQAEGEFSGYGQGSMGYAKRYAAGYGDFLTGTLLGTAVFPAIFKQDPRYFYKGTGTVRSRVWYAIANSVICKGDNGHWQFDYSAIGGGLASAGISNFYYPVSNRNGASLTFANAGIGIADSAVENLIQEFLIRKLTPHIPRVLPAAVP